MLAVGRGRAGDKAPHWLRGMKICPVVIDKTEQEGMGDEDVFHTYKSAYKLSSFHGIKRASDFMADIIFRETPSADVTSF